LPSMPGTTSPARSRNGSMASSRSPSPMQGRAAHGPAEIPTMARQNIYASSGRGSFGGPRLMAVGAAPQRSISPQPCMSPQMGMGVPGLPPPLSPQPCARIQSPLPAPWPRDQKMSSRSPSPQPGGGSVGVTVPWAYTSAAAPAGTGIPPTYTTVGAGAPQTLPRSISPQPEGRCHFNGGTAVAPPTTSAATAGVSGACMPVQGGRVPPPITSGYAVTSGSFTSQPMPPPRATAAHGATGNAVTTTTAVAGAWGTMGACGGGMPGVAGSKWSAGANRSTTPQGRIANGATVPTSRATLPPRWGQEEPIASGTFVPTPPPLGSQ